MKPWLATLLRESKRVAVFVYGTLLISSLVVASWVLAVDVEVQRTLVGTLRDVLSYSLPVLLAAVSVTDWREALPRGSDSEAKAAVRPPAVVVPESGPPSSAGFARADLVVVAMLVLMLGAVVAAAYFADERPAEIWPSPQTAAGTRPPQ